MSHAARLDALVAFYQTLSPESIARFAEHYAEDAYFKDPFNEVRGLLPIQRTWERGSGETLACGTGACAAVASGIRQGLLKSPVKVHLPGGELSIEWPDPEGALTMVGPATRVFDGRVALN